MSQSEACHYVVTAYAPGAVLHSVKCNFLEETSEDVVIAKASRLEVRTLVDSESLNSEHGGDIFPVVQRLPVNGRISALESLSVPSISTSLLFILQERLQYAVISYTPDSPSIPVVPKGSPMQIAPHPVTTHASGSLLGGSESNLSKQIDMGPLIAVDSRCIVLHVFDGLLTILPVNRRYKPNSASPLKAKESVLLAPFHCRVEEITILDINFLNPKDPTDDHLLLAVLHQDSHGMQSVTTHVVNLQKKQLVFAGDQNSSSSSELLKKPGVDGGSCMVIPIQSLGSSALIVGQRQVTLCSPKTTKTLSLTPAAYVAYTILPPDEADNPRVLLGDEFGSLHIVTVAVVKGAKQLVVSTLHISTLGDCSVASTLEFLGNGLVYVGSTLGDSQLIKILDEPVSVTGEEDPLGDTTFLKMVDEYKNLGPILDFDLVPIDSNSSSSQQDQPSQSQVVTASGCGKSGTIQVVRNGIGMEEIAAVEIPGIQAMWSLRKSCTDTMHTYLVQSFVGETRVMGVTTAADEASMSTDEEDAGGGGLEEASIPGLMSTDSSLYVGNVTAGDRLLQITESEIRLISWSGEVVSTWSGTITVASANELGQIAVALHGGMVVYLEITNDEVQMKSERQMDREVSCLNINAYARSLTADSNSMETNIPQRATLVAIGLWDDYTVRLLAVEDHLNEVSVVDLSTEEDDDKDESGVTSPSRRHRNNAMARSLCMMTMDYSSASNEKSASRGVNMLFVGLGDGTLVSFSVVEKNGEINCQSKKEVCLGTQRIDLIPLQAEQGSSCVLATGDRPTVVYLAGAGGGDHYNPKLCYSTVNVAATDEDLDVAGRPPSTQNIAVTVATPFMSSLLLDSGSQGSQHYALCVADDKRFRLGVIDGSFQKLHVTSFRLGMSPRRIVWCDEERMFAVGCIESGLPRYGGGEDRSMGNCIRFMDATTFEDLDRIDMEPYEEITTMAYVSMKAPGSASANRDAGSFEGNFLLVGTAYTLPDKPEPESGRILVYSCTTSDSAGSGNRSPVRQVTELAVEGAVFSICQFYDGRVLASVNTRVHLCALKDDCGVPQLAYVGESYHGHILSLYVQSRATRKINNEPVRGSAVASAATMEAEPMNVDRANTNEGTDQNNAQEEDMIAIVGDVSRSISLLQYYPKIQVLEEVARDYNVNWMCAIEMLSDNVYLGGEQWCNLFCLRRNIAASSEEVRSRLDTTGEFHLGEMCNKFKAGSLVMPTTKTGNSETRRNVRRRTSPSKKTSDSPVKSPTANSASRGRKIVTGSQNIFGTVDGTLGVILGLDGRTAAFFSSLERAMAQTIQQVGNFSHQEYRAFRTDKRDQPAHGFVDGDLVESFLDFDHKCMSAIVEEMNRDGGWDFDGMDVRSSTESEASPSDGGEQSEFSQLTVEDVLAMVEEMNMLH